MKHLITPTFVPTVKKTMACISIFIAMQLFSCGVFAQAIATYAGSGGTSTAITGVANETVSALTKTGYGSTSACSSGGLSGMTIATSVTSYSPGNAHVYFQITPNAGYTANVTSFSVGTRESGTGPQSVTLAYSLDGGSTWTQDGSTHPQTRSCGCGSTCTTASWNGTLSVTGITPTNGIILAIYGYSSTNASGSFQINTITVNGSIQAGASVALSVINPAAGNVSPGATNALLQTYSMSATGGAVSVSGLKISSIGTYSLSPSTDVNNLKCWYSNSSAFSVGTSTLLSTYSGTTAGSITFPAFSSTPSMAAGTSGYLHITADIAAGATTGHTIGLAANSPLTNLNVGAAAETGSLAVSNFQTIVSGSNCTGTSSGTVTPSAPGICGSGAQSLAVGGGFAGGAGGILYQWSSSTSSGGPFNSISGATNSSYTTPTISSTNYYECITTCTFAGSPSSSSVATVTVNASPTVTVTPAGGSVCSATGALSLTATGAGTGGLYSWSPVATLSASTGASVNASNTTATTYTVTGTTTAGCSATNTVTVNYNFTPSPVTLSTTSVTVCPGAPAQQFIASGGTVGPTTVSSGTINVTISGAASANTTSSVVVTGVPTGATITSAYVTLNATHGGYQNAFVYNLAAPNGKIINLIKGDGTTSSGSYTNTIISSAGTTVVSTDNSPFSSTYKPDASLSVGLLPANTTLFSDLYGGTGPNGTWTLDVFHNYSSGSDPNGNLISWSITINYTYQSITWSPSGGNLYTNSGGTSSYTGTVVNTVYATPNAVPAVNIYTVVAANGSCLATKIFTVTTNASPTISGTFSLSPTSVCPNDVPVALSFTGSISGTGDGAFVSYNWNGPGGFATSGSSASTSFTPTTSAESGAYSVSVTYADPGCKSTAVVSTNTLTVASPLPHNVTGGYGCTSPGIVIGLDGTETGINYQLYNGASVVGSPVTGTGSAISFNGGAALTAPGTYTVSASNGGCVQGMTGNSVIYNTLGTYSVTGGGAAGAPGCTSSGIVIGLSNSDAGVSYQLYKGATTIGSPVTGTGAPITFNSGTAITAAGTYTVAASVGGCAQNMTGSVTIYSTLNTYTVTGGNGCTSPGVAVGLSSSDYGIGYQLYLNSVALGSAITGTGAAIAFGTQTATGIYSVQASVGGGCSQSMNGTDVISGSASFSVTPATTAICAAPGKLLTVSTASVTALSENLNGTISTDGWSTDITGAAGTQWTQQSSGYSLSSTTVNSNDGSKFFVANGTAGATGTVTHLISPVFSLSGLSSATLNYYSWYDYSSGHDGTVDVEISTNGGTSWSSISSPAHSSYTGTQTLALQTASIPAAYLVANAQIRFTYNLASGYGYGWIVDNITVTGTPSPSSYTWSPSTGLSASTGSSVTATPSSSTTYSVSFGGCAAGTAFVRVDALPTGGSINASPATLCTTGTLTLAENGTPSGPSGATIASYSWTGPNSYSHTGTPALATLTPTTTAGSGTYSLTVTYNEPGCTSAPVQSASVAVVVQPSLTVTASQLSLCAGGTITISTSLTDYSGGTPSYSWAGPGIATVTGSSMPPTSFTPSVATASAIYTVTETTTVTGCSAARGTQTLTVAAQPLVTLYALPIPLCAGNTGTLTATYSGGNGTPSYIWTDPAVSGTTATGTVPTYTISPAGLTANVYTVSVAFSDATCNTTAAISNTITPTANNQWNGTTSTDWNTATNWYCGTVPVASNDVIIPAASSYTFAPAISSGAFSAHNLTIAHTAAMALSSGASLDVSGNFSNNGIIAGNGVLSLSGATPSISGNGAVNNLTLNNSNGATIGTAGDTLGIGGTLLLNNGTLTTNDRLMLLSNATDIGGSIGPIAGSAGVSGNVVIQQYVPGHRAYRFWAHPFSSPIPLSQLQNYIDITGASGAANGFTPTATNAPSAFYYNTATSNSRMGSDPGWVAYSNISNTINRYEGIRIFIRGAKGEGIATTYYTPDATTVRMHGTVNTGNQNIPMSAGTMSITGTPVQLYNMIGNPYPSPVDIGAVINTAQTAGSIYGTAFYVWDPYGGAGAGAYIVKPISMYPSYILQANASFQVQAMYNGATLPFTESNKSATPSEALLRSAAVPGNMIKLSVYDKSYHPWDAMYIDFNDAASDKEEGRYDAGKASNPSLNFYSISSDNAKLSIDSRPYGAGKVIQLGLTSSYAQEFIIKVDEMTAAIGNEQLFLHDKYLKQYTPLQQGTEYKFTITKDSATQGDNRFELGLQPAAATIAKTKGMNVTMMPNPASDEVTISYNMPGQEETTIRILNLEGITVFAKNLGTQQSGNVSIGLDDLSAGIYLVEFRSGANKIVQRLVKE